MIVGRRRQICETTRRMQRTDATRQISSTPRVELVALISTDQVLDGAEMDPGQGGRGDYNFVTKRAPAGTLPNFVEPGRRRRLYRKDTGVILKATTRWVSSTRSAGPQTTAGDTRYEDDSPREEHATARSVQGQFRRPWPEQLRGLVKVMKGAAQARNHARRFSAERRPLRRAHLSVNGSAHSSARSNQRSDHVESRDDQLFYCQQRGNSASRADMIVSGFCRECFKELRGVAVEARTAPSVWKELSAKAFLFPFPSSWLSIPDRNQEPGTQNKKPRQLAK